MYGTINTTADDLQDPPLPGGICMTRVYRTVCFPHPMFVRPPYFSSSDLPGTWYMIWPLYMYVHGLHVQLLTTENPGSRRSAVEGRHLSNVSNDA